MDQFVRVKHLCQTSGTSSFSDIAEAERLLTDAIAFKLGLNDRMGLVANGSSVADTSDEEKNRKITIFAKSFTATHKIGNDEYKIVFTDSPGFMDFCGQIQGAIRAADFALITVDAASGVQVGTRRAWKYCQDGGLASVAFVITGLDKDNTDFAKTVAAIRDAFGVNCVPVTAPTDANAVINLLDTDDLPGPLQEIRDGLAESAAETDEALMEKYFEQGSLEPLIFARDSLTASIQVASTRSTRSARSGCRCHRDARQHLPPVAGPGARVYRDTEGNELASDPTARRGASLAYGG